LILGESHDHEGAGYGKDVTSTSGTCVLCL